jgi:HAD-superfamily hydrolase, subfamily IIB
LNETKKAVFFDIDGTLWERDLQIPDSTRKAIDLLKKNGHYAFICSGRTRSFIRNEKLLSLGFDGIIAGCGTYIEFADEVLFHNMIEPELMNRTMDIFKKHKMLPILEGTKNIYVDQHTYDNEMYVGVLKQELGDDLLLIEQTDTPQICKFSVAINDISIEIVANELNPWYDLIVHGKEVMEVIPKGYSKASGIMAVCEKLHIPLTETYAFGDSANDIEMLTYVAHGVAMGNATKEVKEIADYVTKDVKNGGIYHGLKHFGLI